MELPHNDFRTEYNVNSTSQMCIHTWVTIFHQENHTETLFSMICHIFHFHGNYIVNTQKTTKNDEKSSFFNIFSKFFLQSITNVDVHQRVKFQRDPSTISQTFQKFSLKINEKSQNFMKNPYFSTDLRQTCCAAHTHRLSMLNIENRVKIHQLLILTQKSHS